VLLHRQELAIIRRRIKDRMHNVKIKPHDHKEIAAAAIAQERDCELLARLVSEGGATYVHDKANS